jgi:hypothetical protein
MRIRVLTLGLLLMLVGGFVVYQGVAVLNPIAEVLGLVSHVQTERLLIPSTLLGVAASNYSFVPADLQGGVQVAGSFQVVDGREIAMYVMDEGNFTLWRTGHPSAIILAKPIAISYNFTLTPHATGTYYFVFDNEDTSRRTVIFSLSLVEDTAVISPAVGYAGYEIFALGIILFAIGARTGKRKPKPEPEVISETVEATHRCKFCGAELAEGEMFCAKCGRAQQ